MGSLMFSAELMEVLARRIDDSPAMRLVATLKQWAEGSAPRNFREQTPAEFCESSWTAPRELSDPKDPGTPVYIYERVADRALSL